MRLKRKRMGEQVAQSEHQYRTTVDSLRETVFRADADGCLTFLNAAWEQTTGHRIQNSLERQLTDFIHADDKARCIADLGSLVAGSMPYSRRELRFLTQAGETIWIEAYTHGVFGPAGQLEGVTGTLNDISERKRAADRLNEQLAFIDALVECNPTPLFVKDHQRRYVRINPAYEACFGVPPEQLLGRTVEQSHLRTLSELHIEWDNRVFEEGRSVVYEFHLTLADGREVDCMMNKAPLRDSQGRITGLIGTLLDISDQSAPPAPCCKPKSWRNAPTARKASSSPT